MIPLGRGQLAAAIGRRQFISALGGVAAVWPLTARAQRSKMPVIGYLSIRSPLPVDDIFLQELRELGWIEGQNIVIDRRFAGGDVDQLKKFAGELVGLKVDLIVAVASQATQASKDATRSIPVVFVNAGDPVGQGFVESLAHPGRNITGISFDATPDITTKQAQLLIEAVPKASRLVVFWNPTSPFLLTYLNAARAAAPALRVSFQSVEMRDPNEWESAFNAMAQEQADGLIVLSDSFAVFHRAQIAGLAAKHRLPAIYGLNQYVEAGGLMSYGPSFSDAFRRAPDYVDKILKGSETADLPVQQPTKFELAVNLKTAKALGLTMPPTLLATADEVIE
jgi:putative tryptophan/tyrosine transport system substrate-binding protein